MALILWIVVYKDLKPLHKTTKWSNDSNSSKQLMKTAKQNTVK